MTMYRVGVDVGGTNTDAVLMSGRVVIASRKSATSEDVAGGVIQSVSALLASAEVEPCEVSAVMIGTTQFTNALVQRRGLSRVAAIRVCLPADTSIPIGAGWPEDIASAVAIQRFMVNGGHDFDGSEIAELDREQIREVAQQIRDAGIGAVAVNAAFSTVDPAHEVAVGEIVRSTIPDVDLTLGHRVGRIGLLERENAAILNAALMKLASSSIAAYVDALQRIDISAPVFISQNDGTVMDGSVAADFPVRTLSSGPTNSMRGAAFLSGIDDALVLDIGGTTSDAGVLVAGFPKEAATEFEIEGVRTNFRMPDVLSIGVGGGSVVHGVEGSTSVGPRSVGRLLTRDALVFGGGTLTVSDVGVAAKMVEIGDISAVADLSPHVVEDAIVQWHEQLDDLLATVRGTAEPAALVLVGGGAFIVDPTRLTGITQVVSPEHSDVANAVGAAIPQASGEVDRVVSLDEITREAAVERFRAEACVNAIRAGASESSVQVVDEDVTQLTQLGGASLRIRIRAVGHVATDDFSSLSVAVDSREAEGHADYFVR